jgi:hypothetical protein
LVLFAVLGFVENDVSDLEHLTPSAAEVDKIFTRSFEQLSSKDFKRMEVLSRDGRSMSFPVFGPDGDEKIWGLTAMVTDAVVKHVILKNIEQS